MEETIVKDNVVANWVVGGLSVVAFILLLKVGVSYLPDGGVTGVVKNVINNI